MVAICRVRRGAWKTVFAHRRTISVLILAGALPLLLSLAAFAESQTRTDWYVASIMGMWVNPDAVNVDGGAYAFGVGNAYLVLRSQSGFNIPESAVITGVAYRVDAWGAADGATMQTSFRVGYGYTGASAVSDLEWLGYTEHTYLYGGPNELWGQTWTPADINLYDDLTLRADVMGWGLETRVDYAEVTIYYSTVGDTTPPVLTLPPDCTIDCDASCDPSNTGRATATDNLDPNPTVTYSQTTAICSGFTRILRLWVATDAAGNMSSDTQRINITTPDVTVVDVSSQWITSLPATVDVSFTVAKCATSAMLDSRCNENLGLHFYSSEAPIISDGTTVNTQTIDLPIDAPEGTYQLSNTRLHGSSSCWDGLYACGPAFLYGIDLTPPVIEGCLDDILVVAAPGEDTIAVHWTEPTASDLVSGIASLVSTHAPGDVFPAGNTEVVYTATDVAGNVTTCSFDITVATLDLPTVEGDNEGTGLPPFLSAPILLDPEDAPMIGEYPLAACCEIGDEIGGSFELLQPDGRPLRGVYVILYLYDVELIDETPHLTLVDHWSVGYDTETRDWNFNIPTAGLSPGYYYIYLSFPGGATVTLPFEVTSP